MTLFFTCATVAVIAVLLVLIWPFWKTALRSKANRQEAEQVASQTAAQVNQEALRIQQLELARDHQLGQLSDTDFQAANNELLKRVLQDCEEPGNAAQPNQTKVDSATSQAQPAVQSRYTLWALIVLIPVLAFALYWQLGSMRTLTAEGQRFTPQDIEKMVEQLANKLQNEPNNTEGWLMLARSYKMLGKLSQAQKSYEQVLPTLEKDADLLADYVAVRVLNAQGKYDATTLQLIQQTLQLDPNQAQGLWLAGDAQFRQNQFQQAIVYWLKLQALLPKDSENQKLLTQAIEEAKAKLK